MLVARGKPVAKSNGGFNNHNRRCWGDLNYNNAYSGTLMTQTICMQGSQDYVTTEWNDTLSKCQLMDTPETHASAPYCMTYAYSSRVDYLGPSVSSKCILRSIRLQRSTESTAPFSTFVRQNILCRSRGFHLPKHRGALTSVSLKYTYFSIRHACYNKSFGSEDSRVCSSAADGLFGLALYGRGLRSFTSMYSTCQSLAGFFRMRGLNRRRVGAKPV